jgi:hypothetical protein
MGDHLARELGVALMTPHRKKSDTLQNVSSSSDLDSFFGTA